MSKEKMSPDADKMTVVVIGGGAAGFFGAIACAEANPSHRVILLEKARQVLSKVRISGGGRCNVTHACFDPAQLVQNYPRGHKALRGPFSRFQPLHTIKWFESRGVELKEESDGRMFPITDNSDTIIQCLLKEAHASGVELHRESGVKKLEKIQNQFVLTLASEEILTCDRLMLATGSHSTPYEWLKNLGHTIVPPVPSLFTFNIPNSPLHELAGISVNPVSLKIENTSLQQKGPLLITHWGFSGPAILKLSAWGARILHEMEYQAVLKIDWLPELSNEKIKELMTSRRSTTPNRKISLDAFDPLPKNLWKTLSTVSGIEGELRWGMLSKELLHRFTQILKESQYKIEGKTTFKEEFVTCGGINLNEVNFATMESRICPGLYFGGEILDIDGITGGFNFQNAWTTGWIAGRNMAICQST